MPTYVKKADGTELFLPGHGRIREGQSVVVSALIAKACRGSLVLADIAAPPEEAAAPKKAAAPVSEPAFPIPGYAEMHAPEAIAAIQALEYEEDLLEVKAFEQESKDRKTVLAEIEKMLAPSD